MTVALQGFEAVLRRVRAVDSDACDEAIELRRAIGFLELSEGRLVEARRMLQPLHADMCVAASRRTGGLSSPHPDGDRAARGAPRRPLV
ncbi:hypothetical protein ACIP4X_04695 [Streptomyces sp. NPDC088817]|uniref:hypothetical protein n=1 Tax=unclassified Streptomyces TaxID=2593676 RepID=UPI0036EE6AF3